MDSLFHLATKSIHVWKEWENQTSIFDFVKTINSYLKLLSLTNCAVIKKVSQLCGNASIHHCRTHCEAQLLHLKELGVAVEASQAKLEPIY